MFFTQKEKLRFVRSVREFGRVALSLSFDRSFSRYEPKNSTANWLYVVHPDKFESGFQSGQTFRFSWDIARARRWERYYRGRGFHTYLYRAEAHGGANCPVTPSLLDADRARQAYVILHEAWHSTLRLSPKDSCLPYPLEEATGRVVGVIGAVMYAKEIRDADLCAEAKAQESAWGAFAKLVNSTHAKLSKVYSNGFTPQKRKALFIEARSKAERLKSRTVSRWEREELDRDLNNAFFYRYHDYTRFYPLALSVYQKAPSLRKAMALYKRAGGASIDWLKSFVKPTPQRR